MNQTQLNLTEGERRKEEGMERVCSYAGEAWKTSFAIAGRILAQTRQSFTSEDILEVSGLPGDGSRNIIGATMNSLARELKLTRVGYQKAKRPSRHAAVVAIWQLL